MRLSLVDPRRERIAVHRPGVPAATLGADAELQLPDLLPEFSLPVQEIFRPTPTGMNDLYIGVLFVAASIGIANAVLTAVLSYLLPT